ncbi:MAG TPA: PD-(D/E)XK nuclease family transposase [Pseudosphingobacterium sp.]|nr:PD-(D/E)XK nuclease family transposase [Pseudosphingobacterium sp.]
MRYWFYLLKHMSKMEKMPKFLDKRVFKLIFKIGEVSKLKKEERMAYEASLKAKWDTQNAFDSVRGEAVREATEKKSYDVVENLITKLDLSDEKATEIAEVSVDFVQKVRADLSKKRKK